MEQIKETVETVCRFLNEEDIDYVLIGGVAVMVHGRPRSTMDIDFILQVSEEDLSVFTTFLKDKGFDANATEIRQAFAKKSHASVFIEGAFRLDLKGVYNALDRRTLEDREPITLDDTAIAVAPPEHTIVAKLAFGSERDVEDAKSIYLRQESLDSTLLQELADTADVTEELERFLDDVST